jgi:hypothetical protein
MGCCGETRWAGETAVLNQAGSVVAEGGQPMLMIVMGTKMRRRDP